MRVWVSMWGKTAKIRRAKQATSLSALSVFLTSLIIEVDLVGRVEGLPVPLYRGCAPRDPDLALLTLDKVNDFPGDDYPTESGLLVLLVGITVEQADLMLVYVPSIHSGDSVPLVLDDGEWFAPGDQLEEDGDNSDFG